jgi:hypothetical protein
MKEKTMESNSYELFAESSFLEGFARVLDLGANLSLYNSSRTGEEADFRAIKSDWQIVGKDLAGAIESEKQQTTATTAK